MTVKVNLPDVELYENGTRVLTSMTQMTGSSSSAAGTSGAVPAPAAGTDYRYLAANGTWVESHQVVSSSTQPSYSDCQIWIQTT